jgi:hypothetical protein
MMQTDTADKKSVAVLIAMPMGVTPLWCDNWDAGWDFAAQEIRKFGGSESC